MPAWCVLSVLCASQLCSTVVVGFQNCIAWAGGLLLWLGPACPVTDFRRDDLAGPFISSLLLTASTVYVTLRLLRGMLVSWATRYVALRPDMSCRKGVTDEPFLSDLRSQYWEFVLPPPAPQIPRARLQWLCSFEG